MTDMTDCRPLRIVSIAHPAVSSEDGRKRYRYLASRRNLDVQLVVPAVWKEFGRVMRAETSEFLGLNAHILPIRLAHAGPMSWYLHFYPALRRLLTELDPDVIHLWEEPWSIAALQAQILRGRAALVLEVDRNILRRLPPPFESIRRYVLKHTDHILSRSSGATSVVRAGGYAGPVTPISYGVDLSIFSSRIRLETTSSRGRSLRIGYVGRLIEGKGIDEALDAMALGAPSVSLSIMGEGPYEGRLRQRVGELGLSDRVDFKRWGSHAEVADFLHGLDALVLLTRTTRDVREQFGRVIIEAQACGVPVIGSTCGSIPDVVGDGGWIVPERDSVRLNKLLNDIVADDALVRAKGLAARRNVERFSYDAVATAVEIACRAAAEAVSRRAAQR